MTTNHYSFLMMGHNSRPWIEMSLQSALQQDYSNFEIIAIDAQTDDGTYEYLKEQEEKHNNLTVIQNEVRKYQTQNIYEGSRLVKDKSIIVTLDFDDWLPHPNVLTTLDKYYNKDVWMTYGSYIKTSNGQITGLGRYDDSIIEENGFRKDKWRATHLRTFRKELILKINPKDLMDDEEEWFRAAGDLTFMWPMLEMCGDKFEFITEPLYTYNEGNADSEFRKIPHEQLQVEDILRNRKPYNRIEFLYNEDLVNVEN